MNEVIVALATSEMWYFFTVVDRTEDTNADIQFSIVEEANKNEWGEHIDIQAAAIFYNVNFLVATQTRT